MVCCAAGSEITLVVGVSMRVFPSPERHIREADWVGGPPAADWVLLAHSEHDGGAGGGVGIFGDWPTAAISLARLQRSLPAFGFAEVRSAAGPEALLTRGPAAPNMPCTEVSGT